MREINVSFVYSAIGTIAIIIGGIWLLSDDIADQCGSELAAKKFAQDAMSEQAVEAPEFRNVQAHKDGECAYMVAGQVNASSFSAMVSFDNGDFRVHDVLLTD